MSVRDDKAGSLLTELAANYIALEAGRSTLITPTRTLFGKDRKRATIFVSVFPSEEKDHVLKFLHRHEKLFRDYLKKHGRFSILPFVEFEFDYGEQNRQNLDEISKEL